MMCACMCSEVLIANILLQILLNKVVLDDDEWRKKLNPGHPVQLVDKRRRLKRPVQRQIFYLQK